MYACLCRAVSERTVARAVRAGCNDLEELAARCGAGSRCGGCRPVLDALLRAETTATIRSPAGACSAA